MGNTGCSLLQNGDPLVSFVWMCLSQIGCICSWTWDEIGWCMAYVEICLVQWMWMGWVWTCDYIQGHCTSVHKQRQLKGIPLSIPGTGLGGWVQSLELLQLRWHQTYSSLSKDAYSQPLSATSISGHWTGWLGAKSRTSSTKMTSDLLLIIQGCPFIAIVYVSFSHAWRYRVRWLCSVPLCLRQSVE